MDTMYDEYVQQQMNTNWRFWIFNFFMRPLYKSYRQVMLPVMTWDGFTSVLGDWIRDTLSLANLRRGFLVALRKVSTQTSIMSSPEKLPTECTEMAARTLFQKDYDMMRPPRVPVASHKARSRPTTPPTGAPYGHKPRSRPPTPPMKEGGVKLRRRSSNRSDKSSAPVSPQDITKEPSYSNPEVESISQCKHVRPERSPPTVVSTAALDTLVMDDKMLTNLVQSLMPQVTQSDLASVFSTSDRSITSREQFFPIKPVSPTEHNQRIHPTTSITTEGHSEQNLHSPHVFSQPVTSSNNIIGFSHHQSQSLMTSSRTPYTGIFQHKACQSFSHRNIKQESSTSVCSLSQSSIPTTVQDLFMEHTSADINVGTSSLARSQEHTSPAVFSSSAGSDTSTITCTSLLSNCQDTKMNISDSLDTDSFSNQASQEGQLASFQTGEATVTSLANDAQSSHQMEQALMEDEESLMKIVTLDFMDMNKLMSLLPETDEMNVDIPDSNQSTNNSIS